MADDVYLPSDSESDAESTNSSVAEEQPRQAPPPPEGNPLYPVLPLENGVRVQEREELEDGWVVPNGEDLGSALDFEFNQLLRDVPLPTNERSPIDFFKGFFDERMWLVIAQETNRYARQRLLAAGQDAFLRANNDSHPKHSRLNQWRDTDVNELKIFVAHLILMGLIRKPDIEMYWTRDSITQTPFFGTVMSRNRFTSLLSNFHVADDSDNPPYAANSPGNGHDPLAKIRPFIAMLERNFLYMYKPQRDVSIDEGCMPWKGRLRFKCFNPAKPQKFHVKFYQICEATSGYVVAFKIYCGKGSCHTDDCTLDPEATTTTKVVVSLLEAAQLLDKGHNVYMDNYYTSPELFEELLARETLACGTVRSNRKGLPKSVSLKTPKVAQRSDCFSAEKLSRSGHWGHAGGEVDGQQSSHHVEHNSLRHSVVDW